MAKRKREHVVSIRMNDAEYDRFKERLDDAGNRTKQAFGLDALLETEITSQEVIEQLRDMNRKMKDQQISDRNIGNNLNQIVKKVNASGNIDSSKLEANLTELLKASEERGKLWQLLRLLVAELQRNR